MEVEFVLEVPAAPEPDPEFVVPFTRGPLLTETERHHRELLAAIDTLTAAVTESEATRQAEGGPQVVSAPTDPMALAAAVRLALEPLVEAQHALTAEAQREIISKLSLLSKQVVASAGGASGGVGGSVLIRNDASQPVPVTGSLTSSGLTDAQLRASAVLVDTGDGIALDLSVASATVTPGSSFTLTPSSGHKLRLWWVNVTADPENSDTGKAVVNLAGKGDIYRAYDVGHRQRFDGSTNGALTVTSDAGTYEVTIHYQEV